MTDNVRFMCTFGKNNAVMDITITKKNIYDYVLALTARAGKALGVYEQIAVTEDNYPMLDVYLSSAIVFAEGTLRRKLDGSNSFDLKADTDSITITVRDQMRLDDSIHNLVESGVRLYLAYHVAASWLLVTPAKDYHAPYTETAIQHLNGAYNALNQKKLSLLDDSEYKQRKGDNVTARPGTRITDREILTIRSCESCDSKELVEDATRHILVSNQ